MAAPSNVLFQTSSITQPIPSHPTSAANSVISKIRDRVLEIIRSYMPLTTLFTPELRINLGVFVKDQIFFHKIAEFIAPLVDKGQADRAGVQKHFEGSEILNELKALFKGDPANYLPYFYDACADVLNGKTVVGSLSSDLGARIFTLNNSLIAQHEPEKIQRSQAQNKLSSQAQEKIREEGAHFLRESLSIHLKSLRHAEIGSFQEKLTATAEALLPFVERITKMHLQENGIACPENLLAFRDRSGNNRQGLIAATILEVCLNALGYPTKLLARSDLNPRVTCATAHMIVQVTGPEGERYVVDPAYHQFHKDICLHATQLPKSPVLVLPETEVDLYVENHLMVYWRKNFELVSQEDQETLRKLKDQDQFLPFEIIQAPPLFRDSVLTSKAPEEWIRASMKKIWDIVTYQPSGYNLSFSEIFFGEGTKRGTTTLVQPMALVSLTHHLSVTEIQQRLNGMLEDPSFKGKNSPEALSLIAQLPVDRMKYDPLLNIDIRIKGRLQSVLNAYYKSLKKDVNPDGKDLSALYGCAGSDCISILLATDASDLTFVDLTKVTLDEFKHALSVLLSGDQFSAERVLESIHQKDSYLTILRDFAGGTSHCRVEGTTVTHHMNQLSYKVFFNLFFIGVDLKTVSLIDLKGGIRIDFKWSYEESQAPRKRSIAFITADITKPDQYPSLLKEKVEKGFDIFYTKGAFKVPEDYPRFLPYLTKYMPSKSWLMTTDTTALMDRVNPEECLKQPFKLIQSPESEALIGAMQVPISPLEVQPVVARLSRRMDRNPGTDLSYWVILNLRQKQSSFL